MELSEIYAPVQADLEAVEKRLKEVSNVDFPHLAELLDYSLQSTGKRIRPVLVLISGKFYDYDEDKLLSMATAAEIMHIATLVHDDAIDKSSVRRGRATVNAVWSDEKAVLLGDYLFAEAGAMTASTNNLRAIKLFAVTLKTISRGELDQSYYAYNLEQSRDQYFKRIACKTAALFSMSTESGAAMSKAPEESIQALIKYAYNLGVAFQIVDDILDFIGTETELGKPAGSDLGQGTITLPSLMLMERYPKDNPLRKLTDDNNRQKAIKQAMEMVRNSTIIQDCQQVALDYCNVAKETLEILPNKPGCRLLAELADYVTHRRK